VKPLREDTLGLFGSTRADGAASNAFAIQTCEQYVDCIGCRGLFAVRHGTFG
jgi:hypothetical protein